MAHKYDQSTVETGNDTPQRHHPWYKERLKLKFLKTSKFCNSLDGARWKFIPSGTDDFRSGVPQKRSFIMKKREINPVPIVSEDSAASLLKKPQFKNISTHEMISKNPGCRTFYKRVGPRQQIQEETIDGLESSLLQHPLALYRHLEEAIPPDIVDDVVDILDPDMNDVASGSDVSSRTDTVAESREDTKKSSDHSQSILIRAPSSLDGDGSLYYQQGKDHSIVYRFPLIKTEEEKEREQNLIASKQAVSAKQQSRVKQVTHDLVQWAEQLGGSEPSAYIDEQTIKSLFGSNYETKPILMAPIQVVELSSIPPELRSESRTRTPGNSASTQGRKRRGKSIINYYGYQRVGSKGTDNWPWLDITVPQMVRTKYGAWYLPVRLWKPMPSDAPLKDPDLECGELECEQAQRKMEMDEKVSALHGARAFKEFIINSRQGIIPPFLSSVRTTTARTRRRFTNTTTTASNIP